MASNLPTLSTRTLPTTLVLHPQSCCPTMDVAALSNPTNATGNASLQLYRLSGGGTSSSNVEGGAAAASAASLLARGTQTGSRAWEAIIDSKAKVMPLDPASISTAAAGRTASSSSSTLANQTKDGAAAAATTYIQPRAAESLVWHPEGHTLAFASTAATYMLHSVHDGKATLPHPPFSDTVPPDHPMYLLSWESTLPKDRLLLKPDINAQNIEEALPKLSDVKKLHDKGPTKTGTFVNPFTAAGMMAKPYVPPVPFELGRFPTHSRPSEPLPDQFLNEVDVDDSETLLADEEELLNTVAGSTKVENPTLLIMYDLEDGVVHFLLDGAIHVGGYKLGEGVDVISACIADTTGSPKSPFNPAKHDLQLSFLVSVQHLGQQAFQSCPKTLVEALPPSANIEPDAASTQLPSTVVHLSLELPTFPSQELSLLARAATSIRRLMALAFEAFDEARKGWEEARGLGKRWLSRLEDDTLKLEPELQLLTLLLTGRPSDTNMHEYLASKNTERNTENWETFHLKVAARLRDTAYQSVNPVCERLVLWLVQMRGWALWTDRFGHLGLQLKEITDCIALLQLLMMRLHALEEAALEEETGFREFCGWLKSDMERLVSLDANTASRSIPKYDVNAVVAYIRTRLTYNPIDEIVVVESAETASRYTAPLSAWLEKKADLDAKFAVDENNHQTLENILMNVERNYAALGLSNDDSGSESASDSEIEETGPEEEDDIPLGSDGLYDCQFSFTEVTQPVGGRRKSNASHKQTFNLIATELPISILLSELYRRLHVLFEKSFRTVGERAHINQAAPLFTWKPPDIEEDDAMAALGLARDPTKITSRLLKPSAELELLSPCLYIACETSPNMLDDVQDKAFALWILAHNAQGLSGMAFTLRSDTGREFEILDIEFFDDSEVALLLRHRERQSTGGRFSLGLVRYRDLDLMHLGHSGLKLDNIQQPLQPIPFSRLHNFDSAFEPLQISLNGRKGRRIAAILGHSGKVLEVLDMDPEMDDEEPEEGDGHFDVDG